MMGAVCSALLEEVGEVVIKTGLVKDFWVYSYPSPIAIEELKAI